MSLLPRYQETLARLTEARERVIALERELHGIICQMVDENHGIRPGVVVMPAAPLGRSRKPIACIVRAINPDGQVSISPRLTNGVEWSLRTFKQQPGDLRVIAATSDEWLASMPEGS